MQFLWKYIDDLIGKGLDFNIILELLWYSSITLIPIALPLATLLASMMLTGTLSEKSEITAINSIGQPFTYIIKPLFLFSLLITICSFIISNYAIPYANLKATTLMYDIMQKKLSINIKEKVFFSDIEGYSIKVDKKQSDNTIKDIIIYDYSDKKGINKIFTAESGKMSITNDNKLLMIKLYNGYSFQEIKNNEQEYDLKNQFTEYNISLDLSSFKMERSESDRFSNRAKTMNINQLINNIDSLKNEKINLLNAFISKNTANLQEKLIEDKNHNNKQNIITKKIKKFEVELHRKLTLPIACIIMLIIGSTIGAIIKKGGFGLPVVFSIFLFLIYHIISITGEKMVKKDLIEPIIGMWSSTFIMFTFGFILIIIVNNNYLEKIWLRKY